MKVLEIRFTGLFNYWNAHPVACARPNKETFVFDMNADKLNAQIILCYIYNEITNMFLFYRKAYV